MSRNKSVIRHTVKMTHVKRLSSGVSLIRIQCASAICPLGCEMSLSMPVELWSVSAVTLGEKFCSLCDALAKEALKIAVQDGRTRVISVAKEVGE